MLNEKQKQMDRIAKADLNLHLVCVALLPPLHPTNVFKYINAYTAFNAPDNVAMCNADKLAHIIKKMILKNNRKNITEWLQVLRLVLLRCQDNKSERRNGTIYAPINFCGITYRKRNGFMYVDLPPYDNEEQTTAPTEGENIK